MEPEPKWIPALTGPFRCTREHHTGPCEWNELDEREWRKHSDVEQQRERCPVRLRKAT